MTKRIEYVSGQKLGECIYLHDIGFFTNNNGKRERMGLFKCGCGKIFEGRVNSVKKKNTKSCGCRKIYAQKNNLKTHGLRHHPVYHRWLNIKQKCLNPRHPDYIYYGAKGISICDEWIDNPEAFINYLIELPGYGEPDMTLDREKNEGNYEPGNVRWATRGVQAKNRGMQKSNTSGYTGVAFRKDSKKWRSYIRVDGKTIRTGNDPDKRVALEGRNDYIRKHNLTEYKIQEYHG